MPESEIEPSESVDSAPFRSSTARWALLGLLVVLLFGGYARVRLLRNSSPYVLHEDELIATRRAASMLENGDWNPRFFRYPTLTIYLTAVSFGASHLVQGETVSTETGALEPIYERPEIGLASRYLMIGLSLATMVFVGALARRVFDSDAMLFLAPLCLLASPRFLMMSWTYVNVDLVGACVCTGALWLLFATRHRDSWLTRAALPGLLTGLAVGAKYYLGLIGLPAACVILASGRKHMARNITIVVVMTVIGFLISTPYSVLDTELFVSQVQREMDHYAGSHKGADAEPGLAQLLYYLGRTWDEFGWGPCLFGLVGIVAGLRRDARKTGLLLAFPIALLLFLSTQRVHFIRNFLSVYALFPAFIAFGVYATWRLSMAKLPDANALTKGLLAGVFVATFVLTAPFKLIWNSHTARADSRNQAVEWIQEHAARGTKVMIAEELMFDARALEKHFEVEFGPLVSLAKPSTINELSSLESPTLFVVPEVKRDSNLEKHFGRSTLRVLRRLDRSLQVGKHAIPRESKRLLHLGNPALEIRSTTSP
ncbi:MAG: hypothetical protein ACI8TQ_003910 [Planctomycetota bacterium]|jgi:hypothetical protein